MGLRDREWFHQDRNNQKKPQQQSRKRARAPKLPTEWEPSWAVVIVVICAAAAAIYWL
ncbi:hypothetical protein AADS62_004766 [Escherichia coli]